jgi:hypothetical protein
MTMSKIRMGRSKGGGRGKRGELGIVGFRERMRSKDLRGLRRRHYHHPTVIARQDLLPLGLDPLGVVGGSRVLMVLTALVLCAGGRSGALSGKEITAKYRSLSGPSFSSVLVFKAPSAIQNESCSKKAVLRLGRSKVKRCGVYIGA